MSEDYAELLRVCTDLLNACDNQMFSGGVTSETLTAMEQARAAIAVSEPPADNPMRPTLP